MTITYDGMTVDDGWGLGNRHGEKATEYGQFSAFFGASMTV
jgi:hypothetical protein